MGGGALTLNKSHTEERGKEKSVHRLQACRVQDFKGGTRCLKCQRYAHVQKYCKEEEKTCAYGTKEGHMTEECPDKKAGKQLTCPAWRKARNKSDHAGSNKKCPAFKMALERLIRMTDYGA